MSEIKTNIFFDESGNKNDSIKIMGAFLMPKETYETKEIQEINKKLRDKDYVFHFTSYSGNIIDKSKYLEVINTFSNYLHMCHFNVIAYEKPVMLNNNKFDEMVYSKFPERIFYGLLRCKGNHMSILADIFIENSTQYSSKGLDKTFKDTLNIQAVYRGEHYEVKNCEFKSKNEEIGVEFTDILLGLIRQILMNDSELSKTKAYKNELILEMLKIPSFRIFLSSIKYYEWSYTSQLREIHFAEHINFFISRQTTLVPQKLNKES